MAQPEQQPLTYPGEKVEAIDDQFWYPVHKPGAQPVNPQMLHRGWRSDWNWNDQPREKWAVNLACAPCATCGTPYGCDSCCDFCFGCWCPCCAAYSQRRTLLFNNLDNYQCCAGMLCKPSFTHRCCPGGECGLCLEACCCTSCAVIANRWMLKNHYNVENTCCETTFIVVTCLCSVAAAVTRKQALRDLGKLLWHTIVGCMYAQQEHEMRTRGYPDPRRFPQYHGHVVVAQVLPHPHAYGGEGAGGGLPSPAVGVPVAAQPGYGGQHVDVDVGAPPQPPAAPYIMPQQPAAAPYMPQPPAAPYMPQPPAAPYMPQPQYQRAQQVDKPQPPVVPQGPVIE